MNQDPAVREFFPGLLTFDESRASVRINLHKVKPDDDVGLGTFESRPMESAESIFELTCNEKGRSSLLAEREQFVWRVDRRIKAVAPRESS